MQVYNGNLNKVAKSQGVNITFFEKGLKKSFARSIKRAVRQEGRNECINSITDDRMTTADVDFLRENDIKDTFAAIVQTEYENPGESKNFCLMQEKRIREAYGYSHDVEYFLYRSGLSGKFYNAHNHF